ncbi:SCO family protein [Methylorubrum extorquens]|uniref:SCO family protein n=1 Tax=Methylorubrum extorquens TaxID=408 RepID=UPI00209CA8CE|nr:SCO family protein [Methylorubrum extorquens]MCP1539442.1 protein SCO1/2 [Methylorubrum extorquens]
MTPPPRRRSVRRLGPYLARAASLLALLLLPAAPGLRAEPSARPGPAAAGAGLLAGHFRLVDPAGCTIDSDMLAGKPYGLFFGFTHCPEICPTTLAQLSTALRGIADPDLRIYFVTLDPERDTPAALASYMQSFDPRIVALGSERAAIDEAVASFGVVAERTALPEGRYTYAHTAAVLVVDENGLIADRVSAEMEPTALAARLAPLARPPEAAR